MKTARDAYWQKVSDVSFNFFAVILRRIRNERSEEAKAELVKAFKDSANSDDLPELSAVFRAACATLD